MSRTMVLYLASVPVMWIPGTLAVHGALKRNFAAQVLGGLLVAVVWPFAMPVVASISMSRRERLAQLVPTGTVLPATSRSSVGTSCSRTSGVNSASSRDRHPPSKVAFAAKTITR